MRARMFRAASVVCLICGIVWSVRSKESSDGGFVAFPSQICNFYLATEFCRMQDRIFEYVFVLCPSPNEYTQVPGSHLFHYRDGDSYWSPQHNSLWSYKEFDRLASTGKRSSATVEIWVSVIRRRSPAEGFPIDMFHRVAKRNAAIFPFWNNSYFLADDIHLKAIDEHKSSLRAGEGLLCRVGGLLRRPGGFPIRGDQPFGGP